MATEKIIPPEHQPAPECAYEQQCAADFRAAWADHPGLLALMRLRCATLISPAVTEERVAECQRLMGFEPHQGGA
jgi:hypothetical protein